MVFKIDKLLRGFRPHLQYHSIHYIFVYIFNGFDDMTHHEAVFDHVIMQHVLKISYSYNYNNRLNKKTKSHKLNIK